MDNRPGCLSGLLKLFFIEKIFNWLQGKFGFGRGVVMFIVLVGLVCSVLTGTDWTHIGF